MKENCSVIDGRQQLIRIKDVPKQSQTPGLCNEDTHRGTIDLKGSPDNTGKTVIILDDVWTSGSTLRVCKEVIEGGTNPSRSEKPPSAIVELEQQYLAHREQQTNKH